jgi:hypothetical protein
MNSPTADPMLACLRRRDKAPAYWPMGILIDRIGTGSRAENTAYDSQLPGITRTS